VGPTATGAQLSRHRVDDHHRVGRRQVTDVRPRAELGRPQHLAPIHVADAHHHVLIEQHVAQSGVGFGIGEQQLDRLLEIHGGRGEIGAEPAAARMATRIRLAVGLDVRRVEADRDPVVDSLEFRRILFDYNFSEATDDLFRVANTLTRNYHADLRVLSVIEPLAFASTEAAPLAFSRTSVQTMVRGKLNDALLAEGKSVMDVPAAVEWGRHAETVLRYAKTHRIDLLCTTLAPPHFYFEKLYSAYLGSLLKSAVCPILVKQSLTKGELKNFPS